MAGPQAWLATIDPRRTHPHVSLDLDVLDPEVAPGLCRGLLGSLGLVELDPTLDPSGRSTDRLAELGTTVLGRA